MDDGAATAHGALDHRPSVTPAAASAHSAVDLPVALADAADRAAGSAAAGKGVAADADCPAALAPSFLDTDRPHHQRLTDFAPPHPRPHRQRTAPAAHPALLFRLLSQAAAVETTAAHVEDKAPSSAAPAAAAPAAAALVASALALLYGASSLQGT